MYGFNEIEVSRFKFEVRKMKKKKDEEKIVMFCAAGFGILMGILLLSLISLGGTHG